MLFEAAVFGQLCKLYLHTIFPTSGKHGCSMEFIRLLTQTWVNNIYGVTSFPAQFSWQVSFPPKNYQYNGNQAWCSNGSNNHNNSLLFPTRINFQICQLNRKISHNHTHTDWIFKLKYDTSLNYMSFSVIICPNGTWMPESE